MSFTKIELQNNKYQSFNAHYQMYNWFYPLDAEFYGKRKNEMLKADYSDITERTVSSGIKTRALYFHIPFCETMCSFCPFIKGGFQSIDEVESYTQALIKEIQLKAKYKSLTDVPITSIFFGGGTPSILSPDQIKRIGKAISEHFDLSNLAEFSFEVEAKSITEEKASALREIGVTHGRYGFQTFDPQYRELFTLTATVDQCIETAQILKRNLPYVSFDILYGMNGQSFQQLTTDLEQACLVGTDNIDVYPINNIVTQLELHRGYKKANLAPLSVSTKFAMRSFADDVMRANGFLPHNGHGYVRSQNAKNHDIVVTDEYSFRYHDSVYGYEDSDLIGFGASAVTINPGYVGTNYPSRRKYMQNILNDKKLEMSARIPETYEYATRPLNGCLPYHGRLDKSRVDWDSVHPESLDNLSRCIDAELVRETDNSYLLTKMGWRWYVNLMYLLTPNAERQLLDEFVINRLKQNDRNDGLQDLAAPLSDVA